VGGQVKFFSKKHDLNSRIARKRIKQDGTLPVITKGLIDFLGKFKPTQDT